MSGTAPSAPHTPHWLPLGSAQIIDWKYLGLAAASRGATAWAGRVGGESVLLRTWSSENTTYFEFAFLAFEDLAGTVVITTDRSEPARLRLEVNVDVEGRLGYTDALELVEHSRTGLHGATLRTVDARLGPSLDDLVEPPTSGDAEILEFAPESALGTSCGRWLNQLLAGVKTRLLEGEAPELAASQALSAPPPPAPARAAPPAPEPEPLPEPEDDFAFEPEPEPEPAPEPRRREKPPATPTSSRRPRETIDAPSAGRARAPAAPTPVPTPAPAAPDKLVATTNTGESWEIVDAETYIGRSKQCAIVLKSQRVSRKHASITHDPDGFHINDLGAANGIWAGTERIERELIEDGSEYIIGDVLMTFTYG